MSTAFPFVPVIRRLMPALLALLVASQCSSGANLISRSEFRSGDYNGRIAHALAELAHIAYDVDYGQDREVSSDLLENVTEYMPVERSAVFYDPRTDTAGFIVANDDVVVVSFRGTKTITNMLTDVNATKRGFAYGEVSGKVHAGFYGAGETVFADIRGKLRTLQDSGQAILFTGHSLGGALATLAVARRLVPPGEVFGLYTYGSPRVGDEQFKTSFDSSYKARTYRITNYRDPVPRVPPKVLGFRHIGRLLYFDKKGSLHTAPENPHTCGVFSAHVCAKDHTIDDYIERIGKTLDDNPFKSSCILWPF